MNIFKNILLVALVLATAEVHSQIYDPVSWEVSYKHLGADDYVLIFSAEIEDGWAVYSQYLESDEGPVPTSVNYDNEAVFEKLGDCDEQGEKKEGFDPIFEMNVVKFFKHLELRQKIRILGPETVSGYINFMTCDDTKCLPPADIEFSIKPQPIKLPDASKDSKDRGAQIPDKSDGSTYAIEDLTTESLKAEDQPESLEPIRNVFEDVTVDKEQPFADILEPVTWNATITQDEGVDYISFRSEIDAGWHIYDLELEGDGPIPTEFWVDGQKVLVEAITPYTTEEFDEFFNIPVVKIKKEAIFRYRIPADKITADGEITYMACDQSKCIFPDPVTFSLDLASRQIVLNSEEQNELGDQSAGQLVYPLGTSDLSEPHGNCSDVAHHEIKRKSNWGIFVLGFLGGLLALLTPCVFPMIPLTVSFFTKSSEDKTKGLRNASLYGFFILMVYLLLSIPFHVVDSVNPDILNDISTNIYLNIAFFVIFMFFAFSFFGYYELTIPARWTNKVSRAEGIGGILGIFFMAITLALVSFSCTGPILGTLLAGALTSDGGAIQLTAGMTGFGLALALPFAFFAAFPSWLSSLPKSGGWLTTVKVVLGFLELALAFKFLSNADLVKRWGLLKIEPFLLIQIVIFLGLAMYLFGKIRFPHDSAIKKLSFSRISLAVLSLAFTVYLSSGFLVNADTGSFRSLTLLSGLAPPSGYSWILPKKCPNDLDCFKDLEEGLSYAQKVDKPVMIDFTGHACVNCRKMEEHVWPKDQVIDILRDEFVLISLYVDEKIELPEAEKIVVEKKTGGTRRLR
ncbi:MAG: protein-disulfide reductase DsbD family protein, partial [Saprospiraceae bacterium]|nr:protein-disulfide reductase DsbD family protein [Saprospiraceae bacterium]